MEKILINPGMMVGGIYEVRIGQDKSVRGNWERNELYSDFSERDRWEKYKNLDLKFVAKLFEYRLNQEMDYLILNTEDTNAASYEVFARQLLSVFDYIENNIMTMPIAQHRKAIEESIQKSIEIIEDSRR
jgi:hypothetical protein